MNLQDIKSDIESKWGKKIKLDTNTQIYPTSDFAEDLEQENIIKDTRTKYMRIQFTCNNSILAKCDYAVLINHNIGYISDINIHTEIQNNYIGTNLRKYVINQLEKETHTIYSYPTNDHIRYICKGQKFEPIEKGYLSGWYIKKN